MTCGSTEAGASVRAAVFLPFGVCAIVPFVWGLPLVVALPAEVGAGGAGPEGGGFVGRCGSAAVVVIDCASVAVTAAEAGAAVTEVVDAGSVAGPAECAFRWSRARSSSSTVGVGIQQKHLSVRPSRRMMLASVAKLGLCARFVNELLECGLTGRAADSG